MQLRDEIRSDLARIEYEMADEVTPGVWERQTFTWKNAAVPCTPTSIRKGQQIEVGGNLQTIGLTLFVRRNEFLTVDTTLITVDTELYSADSDLPTPVRGRTLVFRGLTLRILSARETGPRSHYELDLADSGSNR